MHNAACRRWPPYCHITNINMSAFCLVFNLKEARRICREKYWDANMLLI
jgi:hypothetical protein